MLQLEKVNQKMSILEIHVKAILKTNILWVWMLQ